MNTPEILERAADIVDERWWNGRADDNRGNDRCAFLAITEACGEVGVTGNDWVDCQDVLIRFLGVSGLRGGYAWNDEQPDAFTVSNTLRKCAEQLR